jgi:two-component system, OmpR family, response regulator
MRLLVVEDDRKLSRALRRGLEQEGYGVDAADNGDTALELASEHEYDAVVLDVMLPGRDGFAVCRALRQSERWVPVIMLTARADVNDRIRGLDEGADDYLVKPFDFGELLARLRALIRREPPDRVALLEAGDLQVDPQTRIAKRDGEEIELTARELAVLEVLARHAGHVGTREELLGQVWDEDYEGSPNVVDVYVGYLRKKLERPSGPRLIRTVRGVGFVLETS